MRDGWFLLRLVFVEVKLIITCVQVWDFVAVVTLSEVSELCIVCMCITSVHSWEWFDLLDSLLVMRNVPNALSPSSSSIQKTPLLRNLLPTYLLLFFQTTPQVCTGTVHLCSVMFVGVGVCTEKDFRFPFEILTISQFIHLLAHIVMLKHSLLLTILTWWVFFNPLFFLLHVHGLWSFTEVMVCEVSQKSVELALLLLSWLISNEAGN